LLFRLDMNDADWYGCCRSWSRVPQQEQMNAMRSPLPRRGFSNLIQLMLNGTTSPAYRLHGPGEYTHLPPDLDHEERRERGPAWVALWKEGTVSLRPHFRKNARRACIGDRINHSVLQHCEGSGGDRKTDLCREIRRICWIGRSGTKVLDCAHGCPGDVKRRRRIVDSWSTEKEIVDCALFGQMEARRSIAHEKRIVWNRDSPKQTWLGDVTIEIVDLCSRTGII